MSDWGEFADEAEVVAALRGELGDEWRQVAEENFELADTSPDQRQADFASQLQRLHNRLGRPLTQDEIHFMVEDTQGLQDVPDLAEAYGPQLEGRLKERESRQDFMAEVMGDVERGEDVMVNSNGGTQALGEGE